MRRTAIDRCWRGLAVFALALAGGAGIWAQPSVQAQTPALAPGEEAPPPPLPDLMRLERFAKQPQTPLELWGAVDYLLRSEQPSLAAPFLGAFLRGNPSDELLLQIRDEFGIGSVLRLGDNPYMQPFAEPLLERITRASRRLARDPRRIQNLIPALAATADEHRYAVEQLRSAGPYAVPHLIAALQHGPYSEAQRALIVMGMGQLDPAAVPALAAVLDAPDGRLAADAAHALGRIGDPRAIPFLTYPAATPNETIARPAARDALVRLTGRDYAAQLVTPEQRLTDTARSYLTHQVEFSSTPVELWIWTNTGPALRLVTPGEAEGYFGLKFARQALALDPNNKTAQVLTVALALQKAVERVGLEAFPAQDPSGAYSSALAAGPAVLGDVLRLALAENLGDLAATAAMAMGRVTDRDGLAVEGSVHPLVAALSAPDRRVRFAAARALVELEPWKPFPSSNRVAPVLAQFLNARTRPVAVVIDGDASRANTVASALQGLGYQTQTATDGPRGFRLAAQNAAVEVVFLRPAVLRGSWLSRDLLANLRADAATAGIPVFLYGPQSLADTLPETLRALPRVTFVVTPTEPAALGPVLSRELARMGVRPLSDTERNTYAQQAAALLAAIATRPGNPFRTDLPMLEPALVAALSHPPTTPAASTALGDVPRREAQRNLADVVLDAGRPVSQRLGTAADLARSLQRFGPLVTADQERSLLAEFDEAADPTLKAALAQVLGALRPQAATIGPRLRAIDPTTVLTTPTPAMGGTPPPPPPAPAPDTPPAPEAPL